MSSVRISGVFAVLAMMACTDRAPATGPRLVGTGSYVYEGYEPLASKPVRVHYHVPTSAHGLSPLVLVMHGANRNADEYRDSWVQKADEYGFVVAAPEFPEALFPGSSGYALGNVFIDGDDPRPESENEPAVWTYSLVEPLVDDFASRTRNQSVSYHLFGHSAGAQFVHRLLQFVPDGRYGYLIAANAGWYTVPDDTVAFPYGLGGSPIEAGDRSFFQHRLSIHAGTADTNPSSAGLRHTPEAELQGPHRFARAQYFFDQSRAAAGARGASFVWSHETVPGVDHDHEGMGVFAADWLADALGE